jgi:hypothetical protein
MNISPRTMSAAVIAGALAAPLLWAAAPAFASGGGVTSSGTCSQTGTFKLKAKHDDGVIEVEYEVDTNRAGQSFAVRLTDNGTVVLKRTATTAAPSGSFTVHKRITNRSGADLIRAHAVSGSNVCGGHVTV